MESKYSRPEHDIGALDAHWADRQMVNMIGSNKTVLEIGCASGHFGKYLKARGCKVSAVEIDPVAVGFARPYYEKIVTTNIEYWESLDSFIGEKFQVILCSNILEHLVYPTKVLNRLKELLSTDGYFVIALPNVANWNVRWQLLWGNFDYHDSGIMDEFHLRFFTRKTARVMLEQNGLKVEMESFDWDNGIPKFNGLMMRLPGGERFLKFFYSLFQTFFAYQYIFKARRK